MKYLVTGSCGFIGSNLVDMLVEQGHEVVGIDNLSSDAHDEFYFNPKATYYHYDITDYVMCSQVFERHRPDVVFHLAAEARIQNCMNDPGRCMETNVMGTQTMLSLCRKHDNGSASRMVFMSTSAIYGLSESTQFGVGYSSQKETDSIDCLNAYSYSKYFGEQLCKMYSANYGLDTVCFRGFNIYGNRMPKKGQYALVMGIFNRQIDNKESLTIVGDGNQRRDFIHVSDVCRGLIAGATSSRKQNGAVYNLGYGKNYSINDVADMMTKAKYHKVQHTYIPPRNGEAKVTLADISKIRASLGWEPQITLDEWIGNKNG